MRLPVNTVDGLGYGLRGWDQVIEPVCIRVVNL